MTSALYRPGGSSSSTHGYTAGGAYPYVNAIEKFSFTTDGNSTDVGDTYGNQSSHAGQSAVAYGYLTGGGPPNLNNIQKYSFTTDANATDVGDLTVARRDPGGTQY